jgi:Ca-activated chloride channel family protein
MATGTRRAPLVLAVVVGVILILVVRAVSNGGDGDKDATSQPTGPVSNADCVVVHISASSEKAALLGELAGEWAKTGPEVDGTCARVEVASKASGGAADALARGWNEAVDGPRPDVWSPAASTWTGLLRQKTAAVDKPDLIGGEKPPSIATSPLVLAMPKPMAAALGWPDKALGWGDVLKLAQDPRGWASVGQSYGAFTLGKTNPNFSTSGLHATIGAYVAATGTSSDLTLKNLADRKVQAYAQGVERAVVHYGDTTLTFLSNLQKADDRGQGLRYISAAAVEEKSVWDYNQGNPTGDPKTLGQHKKPTTPLVAIYPKEGTLLSDSPYAILKAEWVSEPIKKAAEQFLDYVRKDKAQQRFQQLAFRTHDGKAGSAISTANGLLPREPKTVLGPPAPSVLAKVQSLWNEQRKGARVLLIIDTSGSMGEAAGSGRSKLELAKSAALKAIDQFGPKDDVALWSFSTPLDGSSQPYRQLVPFKPINQAKTQLRQQISALQAEGGTALYATARRAFDVMSQGATRDRISAVILLTDGKNEFPADNNLESLLTQLNPEDISRSVRVFPIAYGMDADLAALRRIGEASKATAYDASDAASIDKVFTAVLSNF